MNQLPAVLMLGWEYPPHNSGGLGEACRGLTQALSGQGNQIYFTLPFNYGQPLSHMQLMPFPVAEPDQFDLGGSWSVYGQANHHLTQPPTTQGMTEVVDQYTQKLVDGTDNLLAQTDVIHAHDWMTFPAGLALKQTSHKPLITHIHSTEADRVIGTPGDPVIEKIEWQGLQGADQVITVSQYTKNMLVKRYGVDSRKIVVVHNGISPTPSVRRTQSFAQTRPLVAFMGRLTGQKGLPYFLLLAKKILTQLPDALFVIAGDGDMYHELMLSVADQGLTGHVLFSGFIRDGQKDKLLARADVFVMPSLSEPFGLVALEAAAKRTPVVMSDQTGVGEVLRGSIQVPLADLDQMTAVVIKLLTVKSFRDQVVTTQLSALKDTTWSRSATAVQQVYRQVLQP